MNRKTKKKIILGIAFSRFFNFAVKQKTNTNFKL